MQQNKSMSNETSNTLNQQSQSSPAVIAAPLSTATTMTTSDTTSVATGATAASTNNSEQPATAIVPTVAATAGASASIVINTTSTTTTSGNTAVKSPSGGGGAFDTKWIFPMEKITNSPSRLDGISYENELMERQESALFITDLGHMLKRNKLPINTAIIFMHRFYMIHSFKKFQRYVRMVASACLFFACKVEEQPLRLKDFIDAIHALLHKANHPNAYSDQEMRKYGDEIVALESCLIQTLGFNICINHAHTIIIKTCQMIKAPRELAEAAYLTATNSLLLTDFCVKFSPEKVACFCIYLACKWTGMIIPISSEGLQWYQYVQANMTEKELEEASKEYLDIYDNCPPRVHKKLGRYKNESGGGGESTAESSPASGGTSTSMPKATMPPQQAIKQEPHVPTSSSASGSQVASGHSRPPPHHHQPYPNQQHHHSSSNPSHFKNEPHHYQQQQRQQQQQSGRPHYSGPPSNNRPPPQQQSHNHHHQQQQPQPSHHQSSQRDHHHQPQSNSGRGGSAEFPNTTS